jgi:hypothetical protein
MYIAHSMSKVQVSCRWGEYNEVCMCVEFTKSVPLGHGQIISSHLDSIALKLIQVIIGVPGCEFNIIIDWREVVTTIWRECMDQGNI